MKRLLVLGAALVTAAAVGIGVASANNDPHRIYLAAAPWDLPASFCGFPVHFEYPFLKQYAKVTVGQDGATTYTLTGAAFVSLTNTTTGKTMTLNATGPGTLTFSADGTTATVDNAGLSLIYVANGTAFGFPSNLVLVSGPVRFTTDLTTLAFTSMTPRPNLLLDVCAALST